MMYSGFRRVWMEWKFSARGPGAKGVNRRVHRGSHGPVRRDFMQNVSGLRLDPQALRHLVVEIAAFAGFLVSLAVRGVDFLAGGAKGSKSSTAKVTKMRAKVAKKK